MKAVKVILIGLTVLLAGVFAAGQIYSRVYVDTAPPVLTMDADTVTVSVKDDDSALLAGVSARDDHDGDLTSAVQVRSISQLTGENTAVVSYIVFDSADNMATCSRTVCYSDYAPPHFELDAPLTYTLGETITLGGRLRAVDVIDGDLSDSIRLASGTMTNNQIGSYHITVQVTNSMGDTASLPLRITLRAKTEAAPSIALKEQLIYLQQGASFSPQRYFSALQYSGLDETRGSYEELKVRNPVDTKTPGVYEVVYSYTNEDGLDTDAVLTVVVQ